jgi:hypothetical protein
MKDKRAGTVWEVRRFMPNSLRFARAFQGGLGCAEFEILSVARRKEILGEGRGRGIVKTKLRGNWILVVRCISSLSIHVISHSNILSQI